MKKFRVKVSWREWVDDTFYVEAETEEDAIDKAVMTNDEITEDYEVDSCEDLGEIYEPPFEDPNQLRMDF